MEEILDPEADGRRLRRVAPRMSAVAGAALLAVEALGENEVVRAVREALEKHRRKVLAGPHPPAPSPSADG
jgi:hypothetical protein